MSCFFFVIECLCLVYDVYFAIVACDKSNVLFNRMYELHALQYTHYHAVLETLDVDQWTYEVASE